jgi:dephospho-CoA kinase
LADVVIDNNGTLDELSTIVNQLLNKVSGGEDHVKSK